MALYSPLTTGWLVGEEFFSNKHQAIDRAHHHPELSYRTYWFDNEWDQHDWSIEPTETIEELERAHCRALRQKYPVLILAYSGGVDSHTMLHRFLEQGIHLDYIITTLQPGSANAWANFEFLTARNYIQSLMPLMPGTKLLTNNPDLNLKDYFGNGLLNRNNKLEDLNYSLRFHDVGYPCRLALHHPKVYDKLKNKGGAVLIGSNKPHVIHNDQGYWCQFNDKVDENITSDVEFFWTGANAALQIKQCHMAVKWLKQNNCKDSAWVYQQPNNSMFMSLNRSFGRLDPIHDVFTIKNCFGSSTQGVFSQQYGQNNSVWAQELQQQDTQNHLWSLYHEVVARQKESPRFYGDNAHVIGWLTKPRFLTK